MKHIIVCMICLLIASCTGQHQAKKDHKQKTNRKQLPKIVKCRLNSNYNVSMKYLKWDSAGKVGIEYSFDVILENRSQKPRWFIFPEYLSLDRSSEKKEVNTIYIYKLLGKKSVFMGEFFSPLNILVFNLPPRSRITIKDFKIKCLDDFDDIKKNVFHFNVTIAREIFIQNEKLNTWLGKSMLSSLSANVNFDYDRMTGIVGSKSVPNFKSVPVTIDYDCAFRFAFSETKESIIQE